MSNWIKIDDQVSVRLDSIISIKVESKTVHDPDLYHTWVGLTSGERHFGILHKHVINRISPEKIT